jgi:hypothetical protein
VGVRQRSCIQKCYWLILNQQFLILLHALLVIQKFLLLLLFNQSRASVLWLSDNRF